MSGLTVTLCASCPTNGTGDGQLHGVLQKALSELGHLCTLRQTECMNGCARPATLGFRQEGKTAYLFGDISADDMADILTFIRLYETSVDGNLADARPLGGLRLKLIARIPG